MNKCGFEPAKGHANSEFIQSFCNTKDTSDSHSQISYPKSKKRKMDCVVKHEKIFCILVMDIET